MTKKGIVKELSAKTGLTQVEAKRILQSMFETIIDVLERDSRIEIRNFGVFAVKQRAARMARNPRTGEQVPVSAKRVVTFKPGRLMEERIH